MSTAFQAVIAGWLPRVEGTRLRAQRYLLDGLQVTGKKVATEPRLATGCVCEPATQDVPGPVSKVAARVRVAIFLSLFILAVSGVANWIGG